MTHPLAQAVLAQAKSRDLAPAEIQFDYGGHDGKITILEPLINKSGWLILSLLTVESLEQLEDHLIFAGATDNGEIVDEQAIRRLFSLPGHEEGSPASGPALSDQLQGVSQSRQTSIVRDISERNARFFEAEAEKLDGWADDLKLGLEREIKELDRQIKEVRRAATTALTLDEKLAGQKQIKAVESLRNQKRRSLFDAQDQVDKQRDELIAQIEGKLQQKTTLQQLFRVRWKVV